MLLWSLSRPYKLNASCKTFISTQTFENLIRKLVKFSHDSAVIKSVYLPRFNVYSSHIDEGYTNSNQPEVDHLETAVSTVKLYEQVFGLLLTYIRIIFSNLFSKSPTSKCCNYVNFQFSYKINWKQKLSIEIKNI